MAGLYDRNPFDEEDEVNPFAVRDNSVNQVLDNNYALLLFFWTIMVSGSTYAHLELIPAQDGGGRGKSSGQSKYSGGAFNMTSGSVPPATNSRLSPLPPEPADFYDRDAPIDIPLDSAGDFLHAFCGTSLLPLLHGLKREN